VPHLDPPGWARNYSNGKKAFKGRETTFEPNSGRKQAQLTDYAKYHRVPDLAVLAMIHHPRQRSRPGSPRQDLLA